MTARRFDAMVIGGGLVGSAIAWGLRREGLSVALLDEGDAAYRASRGNFGLVWVQSKGLGAPWYQRWTRQSAESWAELANDLAKQTGQSLGLSQPGGLHLCLSDREMNERAERLEQMKREAGNYGFEYRMLDAREAREMLPGLGPAVVGASFTPYDGHVSPLALLRSLHHGFTALGGVYLPNVKNHRYRDGAAQFPSGNQSWHHPGGTCGAGRRPRQCSPCPSFRVEGAGAPAARPGAGHGTHARCTSNAHHHHSPNG
jgi:hydrogen cyanide synthase HcnC